MRVVELHRHLVGQRGPVVAGGAEAADEHRPASRRRGSTPGGSAAPCPAVVESSGIQHARQRLGGERFGQRADEIAAAELLEVEVIRRAGGPQAQRVDGLAAVADHRPVVGNADQRRGPVPRRRAARRRESRTSSSSLHLDGFVGPRDFPRVGPGEPVVRLFVLPAVADGLPEDAVLVAQSVAHARNAERGHRIEETRGQPAQAAVAQTGVRLLLDDLQRIKLMSFGELWPPGRAADW